MFIVGISQEGETIFSKTGRVLKNFDLSLHSQPKYMALSPKGSIVLFNEDQWIKSAFTSNGSVIWSVMATGDVKSLAVTPSGSDVIVGTENGHIDHFDKNGRRSWSYDTNQNNGQGSIVWSVAVSDNGAYVAAGTYDGKILLLNSGGGLQWSNQTKDHIQHVALSGDGSIMAATGDETVYTFLTGTTSLPASTRTFSADTMTPTVSDISSMTDNSELSISDITTKSPEISVVPTEYSVIQTAKGSPLPSFTGCISILVVLILVQRKR